MFYDSYLGCGDFEVTTTTHVGCRYSARLKAAM